MIAERSHRLFLTGAACVMVLSVYTARVSLESATHGFAAYYAASRSFIGGGLGPWVYDDQVFGERVQRFSHSAVRDIFVPNPPTMALLVLPVAALDHDRARTVWLFASLTALAIGWALLTRAFGAAGALLPMACGLLAPAVFANLTTAQAYLVLFGRFTLAAHPLVARHDRLAGAILGVIAVVKLVAVPWIALLAVRGRWRAVSAAVAASGTIVIGTLPWIGISTWIAFPTAVTSFVARPSTSVTAYQTTVGLMRHVCVADPQWNAAPIGDCAKSAVLLPSLVIAAAWIVSAWLIRRADEPHAIGIAACLSLITVPIAEDHQFVMLGIPLLVLRDLRPRWPWFAAAGLALVPANVTIGRSTEGWMSLLAYPRLYATWLLWGSLVLAVWRKRREDEHGLFTWRSAAGPEDRPGSLAR